MMGNDKPPVDGTVGELVVWTAVAATRLRTLEDHAAGPAAVHRTDGTATLCREAAQHAAKLAAQQDCADKPVAAMSEIGTSVSSSPTTTANRDCWVSSLVLLAAALELCLDRARRLAAHLPVGEGGSCSKDDAKRWARELLDVEARTPALA